MKPLQPGRGGVVRQSLEERQCRFRRVAVAMGGGDHHQVLALNQLPGAHPGQILDFRRHTGFTALFAESFGQLPAVVGFRAVGDQQRRSVLRLLAQAGGVGVLAGQVTAQPERLLVIQLLQQRVDSSPLRFRKRRRQRVRGHRGLHSIPEAGSMNGCMIDE